MESVMVSLLHDLQLVTELNLTDLDPVLVPPVSWQVKVAEVEVDSAKLMDEVVSASVITIATHLHSYNVSTISYTPCSTIDNVHILTRAVELTR